MLMPSGPAYLCLHYQSQLLCCPGKVQGLLSQMLQLLRGRASSPARMPAAPLLSQCPGEDWGHFCTAFRYQHVLKAADQTRNVTCSLVVTDSCCFKAVNPDMAHQWQHKPGPHHGLGSITSNSHQDVPCYLQVSSSASLHCTHILLFLFLFHFSTTYLLLLERTRV